MEPSKALLIGFGNPGRRDDGLGPALAEAVERLEIPGVTVDSDYQLTVEDSVALAHHDVVVFVDADASCPAPYSFQAVEPRAGLPFSSHALEPPALLALAEEIFGCRPQAYLLGIRGYEFDELGERLTERASENLAAALRFVEPWLRNRALPSLATAGALSRASEKNQASTGEVAT